MIETIFKLENDIKIMSDRISDYKKLNQEYHDYLEINRRNFAKQKYFILTFNQSRMRNKC